ncbi:unnamed protein product [Lactuca saligna]|uniref:Uncharacterized protein n=1 Tax=Lactuca saligna TaxID=75948 RepID=A0AA35ZNE2_LACSI|nr:unnamed protein product [Lactuca saligna]
MPRSQDFNVWYLDVISEDELADYDHVRGQPPHALVTFGFGGKLIVMKDTNGSIYPLKIRSDSEFHPQYGVIKMTKTGSDTRTNKTKKQRVPNKNHNFTNNDVEDKSMKLHCYMDTRSSVRQGVLSQRRSSFRGNQFPLAVEAARKAPIRSRNFMRNQPMTSYRPRQQLNYSHPVFPLKIRSDSEFHPQDGAGDWLNMSCKIKLWELVNALVKISPEFGGSNKLSQLL